MWKNKKLRAFTLLEALVSLLVISGSVLLFQSMAQLLASEVQAQKNNDIKEWLLFADQLDAELSRSQFDKVENGKLYVTQGGKGIAFGKSNKDDFRKTDSSGRGYQPMLYGLKEAQITKEESLIHIHLQFEKGLEREYVYRVEEKG
ncbi:competence protein ComGF [Streptococcus himalayensis]|uniref:Competence protein ComGF n=1 Tax=Streptococcus himalayensis TaxID=1888195 RepID=A0A917A8Z9_9STRE|nr:competence protein ComGF [Streptococcus himalayensis]